MERGSLTDAERARIADAIRAAETRTSGEIYCVLARSSDSYFYPAAFMLAACMALLAPVVAAVLHYSWFTLTPLQFALGHLAAFIAAMGVLALAPGLRILLVPKRLRYRRAHGNAIRQFMSRNIHRTRERTGVLIFVSLAERYAEILADAAIDDRVAQHDWDAIVAQLAAHARAGRVADGFVTAVEAAGVLLASHFPVGASDRNELDDHIAEI